MSNFFEELKKSILASKNASNKANMDFIDAIKELEHSNPQILGEGIGKKAYRLIPNYIILKNKTPLHLNPANIISNANKLKDLGVNIARPVFFASKKDVSNLKHRFRDADSILYEVQEEAEGSHVKGLDEENIYKYFKAHNPDLKLNNLGKEKLIKEYNLEMSKHRALTGLPHLKRFFIDFVILKVLGNKDLHPENIFFSSKKGYKFFDLLLDFEIPKGMKFSTYVKALLKQNLSRNETSFYNEFIINSLGLGKEKIDQTPDENNFAQFVYNGVSLFQFLKMLNSNTPDSPNYTPLFPNAKKYVQKTVADLYENKGSLNKSIFAMNPKILLNLEKALISNDDVVLKNIALHYGLDENFDFSCIDTNKFLKAMHISHAFDYKDPNPKPIVTNNQNTHANVSVSKDGSFDLEFA